MPKISISDAGLRSLPTPAKGQVDYWDTKLTTFGVRVSQGGSKTFIINVSNSRRSIGRYPVISLSDARTEAKRMLAEQTLGKFRPKSVLVQSAIDLFLGEKAKARRSRTVEGYRRLLNKYVSGKGYIADLHHDTVSHRLAKAKKPSEYNHALAAAKGFFNWCIKKRYVTENPTLGLSPHSRKSRTRTLSDAELRTVWFACSRVIDDDLDDVPPEEVPPTQYCMIVKLLILTGQRRGEIAALHSDFFSHNQQTICLPGELTKNHREHTFLHGSLVSSIVTPLIADGLNSAEITNKGDSQAP